MFRLVGGQKKRRRKKKDALLSFWSEHHKAEACWDVLSGITLDQVHQMCGAMDVQRTGGGGAPVPACQACKPAPLPGRFDAPSQHCPPRFRIVTENLIRTSINSWENPSARTFCCLVKSNKRRDAVRQMLCEGVLETESVSLSVIFIFLKGWCTWVPGLPQESTLMGTTSAMICIPVHIFFRCWFVASAYERQRFAVVLMSFPFLMSGEIRTHEVTVTSLTKIKRGCEW